jgi:hypothetical protein
VRCWEVGDEIELVCEVTLGSRLGAARKFVPIGTKGLIEYVYPGGRVFEVRFGDRVVTTALVEFTPH